MESEFLCYRVIHKKTLYISIHPFHFYSFIYTCPQPFMPSHLKYTDKSDVIYLQCFNDTYIIPTLWYHLILTRMSRLWPKKRACVFLFSDGSLQFWYWSQTLWILWRLWFALSLWVFGFLVWKSHKCMKFVLKLIICRFFITILCGMSHSDKNKSWW